MCHYNWLFPQGLLFVKVKCSFKVKNWLGCIVMDPPYLSIKFNSYFHFKGYLHTFYMSRDGKVTKIKIIKYIPLTNRVRGPYRKLRTEFFSPRFMAQARSARAINRRGKTRIRNLQYGPRKRG